MIYSYSEYDDFRDLSFIGEVISKKIVEIRNEYPNMSEDDLFKLAKAGKNRNSSLGWQERDSVWSFFDESGTLISKENYAVGKKEGTHYVYLPNGVVSEERQFKNGKMHGPYKLYYDKNLIKTEGSYLDGELDGKNVFYFPNGVLAAEGTYKKGQKQGVWIYRENNGKLNEKELYKP